MLYEINDDRAPDNKTTLFEDMKRKREVLVIDDESKPRIKNAESHDVKLMRLTKLSRSLLVLTL